MPLGRRALKRPRRISSPTGPRARGVEREFDFERNAHGTLRGRRPGAHMPEGRELVGPGVVKMAYTESAPKRHDTPPNGAGTPVSSNSYALQVTSWNSFHK